jgi:hypothetical protein
MFDPTMRKVRCFQEAGEKAILEKRFPGSKQPISEPGKYDCE